MAKTNNGLVAYAKAQLGKPYWYGTFGQKSTTTLLSQKARQYPSMFSGTRIQKAKAEHLGVKVHDCVGLIKGYLWCDNPTDDTPKYNVNQDTSANGMYNKCKERGYINTLPEIAGVLVFFDGHVGVYIGGGYVIEARGFDYGVVKTKLSARPWKRWGKCPFITYEAEKTTPKKETTAKAKTSATVKAWQNAAIKDGYKFPKYGADGQWGSECEEIAKKAVIKMRLVKGPQGEPPKAIYTDKNLTKIVQKAVGVTADGLCGDKTVAAIKAYQKKNGLKADGAVGLNTWKKILKV